MKSDLATLLPRDKFDTERAEAIIALGFPAIEPIVPALLEWMQDLNWPVAQVLQPFLASIGSPLAPHIRRILETDDVIWKNWVLLCIVAKSPELRTMLRPDLERLSSCPKPDEQTAALDVLAKEIILG
jgi:uncharacterized protein DUF5071